MESGQKELLIAITSFLNANHIPYMVTGAWSVIYYGRPRASHDIDFVIDVDPKDTKFLLNALKKLPDGFSFQPHAVREAIKNKSMFNILHLPTNLKLDFWLLKNGPFDKSRFQRRKTVKVLGSKMIFATAEDTILQKLRWYKLTPTEKSLVDAAFVYQIQKKNLDKKYLDHWIKELKLYPEFTVIKKMDLDDYI